MLIRFATASLAFLFASLALLLAQDQPAANPTQGLIATDRPSFTNSSIVVPLGSFQTENGFLATNNQGQNGADGPETLVRFGLTSRTELRFTVPDYFHNLNGSGGSGFGDLAIGVKEQLGPTPGGFDVSATLFLSCPTGAEDVSSGGYDPGLQVAWSHGLPSKWTVAGMFSLYYPTQNHTRNLTGQCTLLLDRQLFGSTTVTALGCICRIGRQFSRARRVRPIAALWNRDQTLKSATARLPRWRWLILRRSESFHWHRLLLPIPGPPSELTAACLRKLRPIRFARYPGNQTSVQKGTVALVC